MNEHMNDDARDVRKVEGAELADLYASGLISEREQLELEHRLKAGDAVMRAEMERVRPVLEALLDAGEAAVPRHLREGIEHRVAMAAGEHAQEWAEARGMRSVGARACGQAVGAGAAARGAAGENPTSVPGWGGEFTIVREGEGRWLPSGIRGVRFRTLCSDRNANRRTILLQMDAGTELPDHDHAGMEEVYLVSGDLSIGSERLGPGDYFRVGAGAEHGTPRTEGGCQCIVVSEYVPYSVRSLPRFVWTAIKALFGARG